MIGFSHMIGNVKGRVEKLIIVELKLNMDV
jgi:hypothetical protein